MDKILSIRIRLRGALLALAGLLCLSALAAGQGARIETTINEPNPEAGQEFAMNVVLRGQITQLRQPAPPSVPGLDIQYRGHSNSTQFSYGMTNSRDESIILQFAVKAAKAGTYTIPSFDVEVNGRRQTAPAVTFTVTEAVQRVWSELKLERSSAFVGEMIIAHVYVYFDPKEVRPQNRADRLDVNIPGFTVQDWQAEQSQMVTSQGRTVQREGFYTAISPAKPGKFKIPPITSNWGVLLRSSRGGGGLGFMADDPMFMGPGAGMLSDFFGQRQVEVSTDEIELEVRPLPEKGKPESFSGAVGSFSFLTNILPNESKTGEPLTLSMKIKGTGNFGRVNAPLVKEDPSAWKLYPATSKFVPFDELGMEGTKFFEQLIIPQKATTKLPTIAFTYFDPVGERYITLKPEEIPLAVVGPAIVAPAEPAPAVAEKKTDDPKKPAPPQMAPLITKHSEGPTDVRPLFARPIFWAAQGVPLGLVLALLLLNIRRYQKENPNAKQHQKALRQELAKAESSLKTPGTSQLEAYGAARRALQLHLELRRGQPVPDSQLESALLAQPKLSAEFRADVESFFERQAEVSYSGHGAGQAIPAEEQTQLLDFTRRVGGQL